MRRQIAVKIDQQFQLMCGLQSSGRVWKLFDCEAVCKKQDALLERSKLLRFAARKSIVATPDAALPVF